MEILIIEYFVLFSLFLSLFHLLTETQLLSDSSEWVENSNKTFCEKAEAIERWSVFGVVREAKTAETFVITILHHLNFLHHQSWFPTQKPFCR